VECPYLAPWAKLASAMKSLGVSNQASATSDLLEAHEDMAEVIRGQSRQYGGFSETEPFEILMSTGL
jgi:hypothetical protein